jgi:4-phosphopantoate--beta-alanine ligase
MIREKIAQGFHKGLVHETGLIAHGRGEAFDYLLGERTVSIAEDAAKTAAAVLLLADHPVISVNGNVASLVAKQIVELSNSISAYIEVNLFHRTKDRVLRLISEMRNVGGKNILGEKANARIKGLDHDRGWCDQKGIFAADVVLVPLEDGDRCQALRQMGKFVITIDLNPLSRTAKTANVTIVDNVVRAIPRIYFWIEQLKTKLLIELKQLKNGWNNDKGLDEILEIMCSRVQKD